MGNENKYLKTSILGVNLSNADSEKVSALSSLPLSLKAKKAGIAGNRFDADPVPLYRQTPSERVISNDRNAWIVLGVDRPSTATSGYGGRGNTQCASIDLVAGRMGAYARETDDEGGLVYANPDFKVDASRVYISQRANVDEYFGIVDGNVGSTPARAAVAIKSDEIRLVARGGIKLVTKTDVRNSQGQREIETLGIDLIAGNNDEDMQPLVKGDNLVEALQDLAENIEDLREIVSSFLKYQNGINMALMTHTHLSPFYGLNTSPSMNALPDMSQNIIKLLGQTQTSIISHMTNLSLWENNYLSVVSTKYINSGYNTTN